MTYHNIPLIDIHDDEVYKAEQDRRLRAIENLPARNYAFSQATFAEQARRERMLEAAVSEYVLMIDEAYLNQKDGLIK